MRLRGSRFLLATTLALLLTGARETGAQLPSGVVSFGNQRVIVGFSWPALRRTRDEALWLARLVEECRKAVPISSADSAALVSHTLSDAADPLVPSDGYVDVVVVPRASRVAPCLGELGADAMLAVNGFWVSDDSTASATRRIGNVSLTRGQTPIHPSGSYRGEIVHLSEGGLRPARAELLRLRIPASALFADGLDARADFVVEIDSGNGAPRERIAVPWPLLREFWDQLTPTWASRVGAVASPLAFESPRDSVLRGAHEALASGDGGSATRIAAAELMRNRLGSSDRRYARAQNALTFAEAGDEFAARLNLEYLLDADPCFEWDALAPESVKRVTTALRLTDVRCTGVPLRAVLWRSALFLGYGRPRVSPREGRARLAATSWILGSLATGAAYGSVASARYLTYLESEPKWYLPSELQPVVYKQYEQAESARVTGERLVVLGVGLWVANVLWQVRQEYQYTQRVDAVRSYGDPRAAASLGFRMQSLPRGIGAGLEIRW